MSKRQQYHWGAKNFLANMEVGEEYTDDGQFLWRGLQQVACRLANEFGCKFIFRTFPKSGLRIVKRIA